MASVSVAYPLVARPISAAPLLVSPPASISHSTLSSRLRQSPWPRRTLVGIGLIIIITLFIGYFNIDKTITAEDRHYIQLYLPEYTEGCAKNLSYTEQIAAIALAQERVGQRTKGWKAIPEGQPREPKDLWEGQTGQCFDRSRVLEKIYLYLGFETRHLSLFMRESKIHSWETLLFHHVQSHAISEVLTKHGWLMVDSNDLWLSLNQQQEPVSMHQLQALYLRGEVPQWHLMVPDWDNRFYNDRCIPIYGLYSRHGRFYPPYTKGIPDYRFRGLLYNLEDE